MVTRGVLVGLAVLACTPLGPGDADPGREDRVSSDGLRVVCRGGSFSIVGAAFFVDDWALRDPALAVRLVPDPVHASVVHTMRLTTDCTDSAWQPSMTCVEGNPQGIGRNTCVRAGAGEVRIQVKDIDCPLTLDDSVELELELESPTPPDDCSAYRLEVSEIR